MLFFIMLIHNQSESESEYFINDFREIWFLTVFPWIITVECKSISKHTEQNIYLSIL